MRVEVGYPNGSRHEIDLSEPVVSLGRDPGSGLVLYDGKCSRRHAVLETTSQGTFVRDLNSANGTYLNGRRIDRSRLERGDEIRIGEIAIRLLEEGDVPARAPLPAPHAPPPGAAGVPLGSDTDRNPALLAAPARAVRALGWGWALFAPLFLIAAIASLLSWRSAAMRGAIAATTTVLVAWSAILAWGLLSGRSWARSAQLLASAVGIFLCPVFTILAMVSGAYMLTAAATPALNRKLVPSSEAAALERSDRFYALLLWVCIALAGVLLLLGAATSALR